MIDAYVGDMVLFRNMTRDDDFICDIKWADDVDTTMAYCRSTGKRYNINENSVIKNFSTERVIIAVYELGHI